MKSPKDMQIIQIDITNACIHQCSNCTRFCGHHNKTYFMALEDVKKAIDSLDGFDGIIGIMGGEPTLHPDFVEITKYVASKFEERKRKDLQMLHPQQNFMQAIEDLKALYLDPVMKNDALIFRSAVPGLWSAMGEKYVEHFEIIQDVYKKQVLNDHVNEMYHDPLLVARKDLKIPDDEWEILRDNCWIQNEWSASITPKGAFFCEVAGTLDLLFDGPGGWKVEKDWWKRDVSEFKEQLQWCEYCGAACDTYTRNANEEIDDISPSVYEKLKAIGSKKMKNGKVHLMEIDENGVIAEATKASTKRFTSNLPYADSVYEKFNVAKSKLYPKSFEAVIVMQNPRIENIDLSLFFDQFQATYFVVETTEQKNELHLPKGNNCQVYAFDCEADKKALFSSAKNGIYTAVFSDGILPKHTFVEDMKQYVLNPGALIYTDVTKGNDVLHRFVTADAEGTFMLLHKSASSLQSLKNEFSKLETIWDIKRIWNPEKVVWVDDDLFLEDTFVQVQKGGRYAMYGTGQKAEEDLLAIEKDGGHITCVFDSDAKKHGQAFHGLAIDAPENMIKRKDEFDIIVIASTKYYIEIQEMLVKKGFAKGEFLHYQPQ